MVSKNGGGLIRVLLACASAVRRAGLEAMIKGTPSLKLVGSLQGWRTLAQRAAELRPDAAIVDLEPESPGFPPANLQNGLPIVALADGVVAAWTAHALRSGIKAILPRDAGMEEILPAIQAAYAGLVLLDPQVIEDLAAKVRIPSPQPVTAGDELTPREIQVLGMLAEGLGNRQIAEQLGISDHTVKFHISSIFDKLRASSRTEAVTLGIRMGLVLL